MSDRIMCQYIRDEFNYLYNYLSEQAGKGNSTAAKLLEKMESYYSVVSPTDDDEETYIKIGWFDNELRDLNLILIWNLYMRPGIANTDAFDRLVGQKQDPEQYLKVSLKHFSDSATFLSHEEEKLLRKSRSILKYVGENTNGLELQVSDFPSRRWIVAKKQKTKSTTYNIDQIPEGWEITKTIRLLKTGSEEIQRITLNNNTLKIIRDPESSRSEEEENQRQETLIRGVNE